MAACRNGPRRTNHPDGAAAHEKSLHHERAIVLTAQIDEMFYRPQRGISRVQRAFGVDRKIAFEVLEFALRLDKCPPNVWMRQRGQIPHFHLPTPFDPLLDTKAVEVALIQRLFNQVDDFSHSSACAIRQSHSVSMSMHSAGSSMINGSVASL